MFNLVKKDLKISIAINIFAVVYALFISVMGMNVPIDFPVNIMYILGIINFVFVSVIYSNGYDDKNKSEVVLNSLPIDKVDIVRGKYLTLIIFILISCIFTFLFTNIIKGLGLTPDGRPVGIWDIVVAMSVLLVFYSIYYPFYFKLGDLRMFNSILLILIFIGPTILGKIGKRFIKKDLITKLASLSLKQISLLIFIFTILMYFISLQISKKLYMTREF
ncbi:ABC-2 transporter permease [Anaerosalibacter sp. Marseille-P3206]|uniref:ABC-2 transporter permease n=1 Tax=Anaerosalibacter sp. Marseille-P3206 TaxID=1871005 RepID=UPI000987A21D|nr:ABC-2 transporter permease [Anaerosalibacter sp. Marseille-P3206]